MSIPTTEIIIFGASEALRNDKSILLPALDLLSQVDGVQMPAYIGLQIEDPAIGYVFLNWDSREHHEAAMAAPSHGPLRELLKPAFTSPGKKYHVIFNSDHPIQVVLQQPVTEVLLVTLKDPSYRAEVSDLFIKFKESAKKMLMFGPTLEDENLMFLVIGWESVEAHLEAVTRPELQAPMERLRTLVNREHVSHTTLTPLPMKGAVDSEGY
ncbi:uncharacterized protein EDB91DRAFT_193608 [Suillus paluster]|uniref:uncharacterized protein n=1 Tax=Suillus paluster TaxID=48578 RepID=UPI001B87EB04|nr:uncharacterized protein EDB91DRAFT_193608 [Suillus paluster]KAG1744610.1 hypothetical protein EDB91DRAFT_193608 [Suillus paluster]